MTPHWLCYSQYHFAIWLLNCNDYSDISSACHTIWRLATVASQVACSIQDAAIWSVEVPLVTNSRKGELLGVVDDPLDQNFFVSMILVGFYPMLVLAFGHCRCLRLSVSPSVTKFVRTITHHPFKLGSPNLDHRCKRPWFRIPIVLGGDWLWPSRSNLTSKSKFTPFWACPCDNSSPVHARATKFGPDVLNTLANIPVVLEVD